MSAALTAERKALAAMAGEVFGKWYPTTRLRELWSGGERDGQAWRALAEVGLVGIGIAEAHGGSGGDAMDLVVVLEEAGRACVPEPLVDTAVAAAVLATAPGELGDRWLPLIAGGDAVVSVQLADHPYATFADAADLLLVEIDGAMHAVERDGFEAETVPSEDPTRRLSRVMVTGDAGPPVAAAADARRHGALATAAVLNGVAGALLDTTLAYVKVRQQFGVAVGSFQAVKHALATVLCAVESARAATRFAASALVRGLEDRDRAVHAAKAEAVRAEDLANTAALQLHAGIGFTWEHDLHLWLKRGRALEHAYGSAREHRAALAAALFDAADIEES